MARHDALSFLLEGASFVDALHRRKYARAGEPERLGQASRARPTGELIWVYAETAEQIGEFLGVSSRLEQLRGDTVAILATTPQASHALPNDSLHQVAPLNTLASAQRFLDHWQPDLAVFLGASPPAALVVAAKNNDVLCLWCNAKWDHPRWPIPTFINAARNRRFDKILAPHRDDIDLFEGQGLESSNLIQCDRLREDAAILPFDEDERTQTTAQLAARPVWLAVSAHPSDTDLLSAAHRHVARKSHRMLHVAIPESPEMGDRIARRFVAQGWEVHRAALDEPITAQTQIYVADTANAAGLWYRLSPITFFAGTLVEGSSAANPLEAAALGSAVVHGPFTGTQRHRFDRLVKAQATRLVKSREGLADALEDMLSPDKPAALAQAAWEMISDSAESTDLVVDTLSDLLDRAEGAG